MILERERERVDGTGAADVCKCRILGPRSVGFVGWEKCDEGQENMLGKKKKKYAHH